MASSSSSHQNAAKKIKALLRRTHFPVARLRQLPLVTAAPPSGGLAPTVPAAASGGGNPWDGIVSGDPRAALVVLHWTLLDMSPLFATLLLDRDYAGLTSATDFKFVATSLRMLRDEFNCRPQLTAEQFLTSGFAEVKMRLLADIVELVMRTHHSLASQQKNEDGDGGASSSNNSNSNNNASAPVPSAGNCWGAKSDHGSGGRSSGASSPWNTPTPPPPQQQRQQHPYAQQQQLLQQHHYQQYSRPGSAEGRSTAGGFSIAPPPQPRSPPPLLCGAPIGMVTGNNNNGVGVGVMRHHSHQQHHHQSALSPSPSTMSDEQNAPPPPLLVAGGSGSGSGRLGGMPSSHRRGGGVPLRAPVSVRATAALQHDWHAGGGDSSNVRGLYGGGGGGGGSSVWVQQQGHGRSNGGGGDFFGGVSHGGMSGVVPLPEQGRSPLGPRSAQGPPHEHRHRHHQWERQHQHQHHVPAIDLGDAAPMGMLPTPARVGSSPGSPAGGGGGGSGGSDWLAVQQAFGSPSSALHMPPAVVVPTSPPDAPASGRGVVVADTPMPKLPPRPSSASSIGEAAAVSAVVDAGTAKVDSGSSSSSSRVMSPVGSGRDEEGRADKQRQQQQERDADDTGSGRVQQQQQQQQDRNRSADGGTSAAFGKDKDSGEDDDRSLAEELGKMRQQIEAMLERHSKTLEGRMGETEQMISARLAMLETKVHGLEIGSPLHT
ncbi:unnamed protein product [Ectocarpus sp. CCAP 1310/34]|nr:unnamed protein product [Ectocarpus sp. CCAP 1310/34]